MRKKLFGKSARSGTQLIEMVFLILMLSVVSSLTLTILLAFLNTNNKTEQYLNREANTESLFGFTAAKLPYINNNNIGVGSVSKASSRIKASSGLGSWVTVPNNAFSRGIYESGPRGPYAYLRFQQPYQSGPVWTYNNNFSGNSQLSGSAAAGLGKQTLLPVAQGNGMPTADYAWESRRASQCSQNQASSISMGEGESSDEQMLTGERFSFAAWIKPTALTGQHFVFVFLGPDNKRVGLWHNGNTLVGGDIDAQGYATTRVTVGTPLNVGQTYYVGVVKNGTSMQIYVNGVNAGTQHSSIPSSNGQGTGEFILAGKHMGAQVNNFCGVIDEAALYAGVFPSSYFINQYQAGTSGFGKGKTIDLDDYRSVINNDSPQIYYELDEINSRPNAALGRNIATPANKLGTPNLAGSLVKNSDSQKSWKLKANDGFVLETNMLEHSTLYRRGTTNPTRSARTFSIEMWFKFGSVPAADQILLAGAADAQPCIKLHPNGANAQVVYYASCNGSATYTSANIAPGNHHLAFTSKGSVTSSNRLYVDSVAGTAGSAPTPVLGWASIAVGRKVASGADGFVGKVDNFALYDFPLSPTDISNRYQFKAGATQASLDPIIPATIAGDQMVFQQGTDCYRLMYFGSGNSAGQVKLAAATHASNPGVTNICSVLTTGIKGPAENTASSDIVISRALNNTANNNVSGLGTFTTKTLATGISDANPLFSYYDDDGRRIDVSNQASQSAAASAYANGINYDSLDSIKVDADVSGGSNLKAGGNQKVKVSSSNFTHKYSTTLACRVRS